MISRRKGSLIDENFAMVRSDGGNGGARRKFHQGAEEYAFFARADLFRPEVCGAAISEAIIVIEPSTANLVETSPGLAVVPDEATNIEMAFVIPGTGGFDNFDNRLWR